MSRLPTSTRGLIARFGLGHLPGQATQDVGRRLPGAGVVERAGHHHLGPVGEEVLDAEEVGRPLAGRVRVVRPERARLG